MPLIEQRDPYDRDYTVKVLADACVEVIGCLLPENDSLLALDPCVGGGAYAYAIVDAMHCDVVAFDIDEGAPGLHPHGKYKACVVPVSGDFLQCFRDECYDFIASNPPFQLAEEFVVHGLKFAPIVGYLLLASFIETDGRKQFWDEYPAREVHFLRQRPAFLRIKDGELNVSSATDQRMYAFFIWERGYTGPTTMHCLDWGKPDIAALRAEAFELRGQGRLFT